MYEVSKYLTAGTFQVVTFTPQLHINTLSQTDAIGVLQYVTGIIVTGYGLNNQNLIPGRGRDFFSSLPHPDQLWSPPRLLTNGYVNYGMTQCMATLAFR